MVVLSLLASPSVLPLSNTSQQDGASVLLEAATDLWHPREESNPDLLTQIQPSCH